MRNSGKPGGEGEKAGKRPLGGQPERSPALRTIEWDGGKVVMIDQRKLPLVEEYVTCTRWEDVADAVRTMVIRGAPAIGVAAAMGMALAARQGLDSAFLDTCRSATKGLFSTRPTAYNLSWALDEMEKIWAAEEGAPEKKAQAMEERAIALLAEDVESCRAIGSYGASVIGGEKPVILTHCNAGALATGGYGTALGVIRSIHAERPEVHVLVDETRPFLQGARLTAWELMKEGISMELITDSMAGHFIKAGDVTHIVVGADRIAANGDAANKIGTYSLSVLAREHGVPFYVAAPLSTVDFSLSSGADIPIEERDEAEVTHFLGARVAPEGVGVRNPAFDVTPAANVTAIITEQGVAYPLFPDSLRRLLNGGGKGE